MSAAVLALAFLASGCSSSSLLGGSESPPPQTTGSTDAPKQSSFRQRMAALFSGSSSTSAQAGNASSSAEAQAQALASADCPIVDVRSGASTYAVGPSGAEPTATTLRFQATVSRTARECSVLGETMTLKVGVEGRVILGPAGGPGQVEVPMRLALVQEGVEPRTIWTKAYRIPVTIPPGQSNVPFIQVEEDISFPMPKPAELDAYVVYVGFDPALVKQPEKKPPPKKKPRASG